MLKRLPSGHCKTKVDLKIHKDLRYVCLVCRSVYKWFPDTGLNGCQCKTNVILLPKAALLLDLDGKCKQYKG